MASRDECHMTLAEVAEVLGVSDETVRRIEVHALSKLRRALAREGVTFDDLCPLQQPHDGWDRSPPEPEMNRITIRRRRAR